MSDLENLFDGMDGMKEDFIEYGVTGAAAVASNIVWRMAKGWIGKSGIAVPQWAMPVLAGLLGVASVRYLSRVDRRVANGMAIGLFAAGIADAVKVYLPSVPLAGLGEEGDLFDKFLSGAPTTVEAVAGLASAPSTYESVDGMGDVEEMANANPFGGGSNFAAILQ